VVVEAAVIALTIVAFVAFDLYVRGCERL